MNKFRILILGLALAVTGLLVPPTPATASVDAPTAVESVDRPTDNETNLSFFSCAATRPNPPGSTTGAHLTVNHSHRIAANSVEGEYDWFDCEGYRNPGLNGCVWATYYIYTINPSTGQPYGIFGPFNITCFGDWPA